MASGLAACSAHRQIARSASLFHARCVQALPTLTEPIVHDQFETFVGRRDHALGVGTAVGATSWFVYDVDPAPHHGGGRRPDRAAVQIESLRAKIRLSVFPDPKRGPKGSPRSAAALLRDRAMFPVDQLHQFLRHTCADHKRETISFGRRLESILGRAHLMAVWKNFIKARSERAPDSSTPAMRLGLTETRWTPRLPELALKHAV